MIEYHGALPVAYSLVQLLSLFFKVMASILDRLAGVFARQSSVIAKLKEDLAAALADDAADDEAIRLADEAAAVARAEADALAGQVSELQAALAAGQSELEAISLFTAQLEAVSPAPEPEPMPEPAPEVEPTPEA